MDELIAKIVADTGVDPAVARTSVIVILKFLRHEGPTDKVDALIAMLPGAHEAMAASDAGGSAGIMGIFNDLTAAGLGMAQMQSVGRSFGRFARGKAGDEAINEIVAAVPGLSQVV